MPRAPMCLLLSVMGIAVSNVGLAEDPATDPAVARQQWNARVQQQRERLEEMRREGRSFVRVPPIPSQDQLVDARVRQALDDPALVAGDIVVTRSGLFRFRGTPDTREREPGDFVLIETPAATTRPR